MKLNEIYKCSVCGNITELVTVGGGELVCCGKPMEKMVEKSAEEGMEKHKPIIKEQKVLVGSVPHPMESEHHIEWIEVLEGADVCRKNLKVGDKPEAEFCDKNIKVARALCNIHGLWKNE
ncbi:MAG: desulfoferrodoxin family protein [Candidatus Berkelbacteria bacterium]